MLKMLLNTIIQNTFDRNEFTTASIYQNSTVFQESILLDRLYNTTLIIPS